MEFQFNQLGIFYDRISAITPLNTNINKLDNPIIIDNRNDFYESEYAIALSHLNAIKKA